MRNRKRDKPLRRLKARLGGTPPLGYEPDGRTLRIVEEHAAIIRIIFARYLELRNVRLLEQSLTQSGIHAPARRRMGSDQMIGGRPLSRGQLYKILKNRIYIGEIVHGEHVHAGLHPPILDRELWEKAQVSLAENLQGSRDRTRATQRSLLAGKIVDEDGGPLIAVHSCKGKVRYRYYVSQALHEATSDTGMRIPAREIEGVVSERLAKLLDDPVAIIAAAWLDVPADTYGGMTVRAQELAARVRQREYGLVRDLVREISVERGRIGVICRTAAIAVQLGVTCVDGSPTDITISSDVRLTRSGKALRLIDNSGSSASAEPNAALVRLIAEAHRLWGILRSDRIDITRLAEREGMLPSYLTRVLRLAFLSPAVVGAVLTGTQHLSVNVRLLTLTDAIVGNWDMQAEAMFVRQ